MPFGAQWPAFLDAIQDYVVWGPKAVVDSPWDITYVKINYHGQKIEIGDSSAPRIQNGRTGEWIDQVIDFESSVAKTVLGCRIEVMPQDQLIADKKILARDVDLQDIRDITANAQP